MITIKTTAGRIAAAHTCAASKDVRFFLVGIFFEPDNNDAKTFNMIASDGHRMIVVPSDHEQTWEASEDDPRSNAIVSFDKDTIRDFRKKSNRETDVVISISPQSEIWVDYLGRRVPASIVDGKYPDWKAVMPSPFGSDEKNPTAGSVGVQCEYLATVNDAAKLLSGGKELKVEMTTSEHKAIMFTLGTDDPYVSARMIIMPCRL